MNKKTAIIIGLQAILIVTLFWVLIFYGKDEYEAYQTEQEEEIEGLNRVSSKEGINTVSLSPAVQANSGIVTAKISKASFRGEQKSLGNVVAIDSLIDAKARYLSLITDANIARAANSQNLKQYQRLKELNADDKNVSDRAVQEALAVTNADKAKVTSAEMQLKSLQTTTQLQWGEELAKLILSEKLAPHLQKLLSRENVLVQISLPLASNAPVAGSSIGILPLNERINPIKAFYVSPATQSDSNGFGKTFYYSAPAESLRIGMRVSVEAETKGETSNGVIIPSNAVVWYAGKPWAYFKQGANKEGQDQFVRKPISADTEVDTGWFNQGLSADSEVVVSGAQLLLSEEFKYLIKNENED
jgi:hypothetical protein